MADRQFNPLGTENAPAGWTLPGNLQLLLKNVYATFDGTNAAGDFQPCLEIVSDSGHTVGSYTAAKVTAGGSADVTFFPRVGGSTAAGTTLPLFSVRNTNVVTLAPSATTPQAIPWPRFATTDASFYSWNVITNQVRVLQTGTYASFLTVNPNTDWPTAPTGPIRVGTWGGDQNEPFGIAPYGQHATSDVFTSPGGDTLQLSSFNLLDFSAAASWQGGVMNFSGANFSVIDCQAWVWRVGDLVQP